MANRDGLLKPVPTMKTTTDGDFYIPNTADLIVFELFFNDPNIVGDQVGVDYYPDRKVDINDLSFVGHAYGKSEGQDGWDYMADIVPDGEINILDLTAVSQNFGKSGYYSTSSYGVTVMFDTGGSVVPDDGFVIIPQGATTFTVKRQGSRIGAMIRIGQWL